MNNIFANIVMTVAISLSILFSYDKYIVKNRTPKIYTLDVNYIVNKKKEEIKNKIFNKGILVDEKEIVKYLNTIDKIANIIAKRDNAIIVAKSSIITGATKDITKEVLKIYNNKIIK